MVFLKSDAEIDLMKEAGLMAWQLLEYLGPCIRPGISTLELNNIAHDYIVQRNAVPAPLNYMGFPKSICTSVNHVICHGIPNEKEILREGDIINIDVTPIVKGFHGDSSRTYLVGKVSDRARKLVEVTKQCLDLGIAAVKDGCRVGDIGAVIQKHAESHGYSVVKDFVGHGIGRTFHEDPKVPHYGTAGKGPRLTRGMVFTIEPMINEKDWRCKILKDGWTAVTVDGKLSAQFEHTIAIRNEDGRVEILTAP